MTLSIPILPIAALLGLTPMPYSFLWLLAAILAGYILTAELAKQHSYTRRRDAAFLRSR